MYEPSREEWFYQKENTNNYFIYSPAPAAWLLLSKHERTEKGSAHSYENRTRKFYP